MNKHILEYLKRCLLLLPIIICVFICIYFIDLLSIIHTENEINNIITINHDTKDITTYLKLSIGLLLVFTAFSNWIMIAYIKHLKYKFRKKLRKYIKEWYKYGK